MKKIEILNSISDALSHGHTLSAEHAARLRSLESLQAAWRAAGIEANDASLSGPGLTGWGEEYERGELAYLTHMTGSGRLSIRAAAWHDWIRLVFSAGGNPPSTVITVDWDPTHPASWSIVEQERELWLSRPDRLCLIQPILTAFDAAGLVEDAQELRELLSEQLAALGEWQAREDAEWQARAAAHAARFERLVAEHPNHEGGERVYSCATCRAELAAAHAAGDHAGQEPAWLALCDACSASCYFPFEDDPSPSPTQPPAPAELAARDAADFLGPAV